MPKLLVYATLFCIVFSRAAATYAVGRGLIAGASRMRMTAKMQGARYRQACELVARFGAPVVSLCFLTVGFQTMVLLASGGLRMPLRKFLPALAVGSVLWALLYGTVGFVGFHALRVVWEFSPLLCAIAVCLLLAASIGYVLYRRIRSRESAHSKTDQYVSESVAE
ncbi:MAG: VTT domain-containing protein [Propionibacteriaceae bacterium]|nr:VTT domain-containing protein [Brooklawnia sp. SH051]MCB0883709.1 VTT domain-containing protein [Propionibacteriaceae bacterium]